MVLRNESGSKAVGGFGAQGFLWRVWCTNWWVWQRSIRVQSRNCSTGNGKMVCSFWQESNCGAPTGAEGSSRALWAVRRHAFVSNLGRQQQGNGKICRNR
jgi:hypothetical protein